jgi:hypothetical protein
MNPSPVEIELLVRRVLQSVLAAQGNPTPEASHRDASWSTDAAVVGLDSLRPFPPHATHLRVASRALITPAARDWCREKRISIVRGEAAPPTQQANPPIAQAVPASRADAAIKTLFVTGTADWVGLLSKQLCSKRVHVDASPSDDATAMRGVADALRRGHRGGLAIVSSPYSCLWQAARDEALRPACVSQWSDLPDILREVPTNVLIVSSQRWSVAGVANIARRFLSHLSLHGNT